LYFLLQIKDESQRVDKISGGRWLVLVRTKGSHRQFHHPAKSGTVTIAGKESVEMPKGTANSVLKQAGIKK
jgi:predicted RNA binding protein YcfA (HicA-like mRNA interferase family)